ncbi:MAG: hypothetical protein AB7N95_06710 [Nitrospiraceae bacterium]
MPISRNREQSKMKLRALQMMAVSGVLRPAHVEVRYAPRSSAMRLPVEKDAHSDKSTSVPSPRRISSLLTLAYTLPVMDFIRHLRECRFGKNRIGKSSV